jgi:N utilization substance protein B
MGARTKARKRALDVLFSADVRGISLTEALEAEANRAATDPERAASWLYAREIVDGVIDHGEEIDETIQTYARGWTLERMPAVDRAVIRIAVWELLYNPEVSTAVAIDEAVESVKTLSTDESAGFVNGLLATIASTSG